MPVVPFRADLIVPAREGVLDLIGRTAADFARLAGFIQAEAEAWTGAVTDAYRGVLGRSEDPARPGSVQVIFDLTPGDLAVAIRDRGLPFDPQSPRGTVAAGTGPDRLRGAVDEAHWSNLGREGLELRLVKHRAAGHVGDLHGDLTQFPDDIPLAPDQTYTIRCWQPGDEVGVAQCIYRTYGYGYPNEDVYYPDRIAHQNETGELVSVVAVDEAGEVVGHVALERPGLGPIAEAGQAVVSPVHRHRHLLDRMADRRLAEATRLGLAGIFSQPVTSHTFSQQELITYGFQVCGVSLGHSPAVSFAHIRPDAVNQRESLLLCFKYLAPPGPPVVHVPDRHRPILERLYAGLGLQPALRSGAAPGGSGHLSLSIARGWSLGSIRVDRAGDDSLTEIRQIKADLTALKDAAVIYVDLPLADPGTPDLCAAIEAEGFFFAGIGPGFAVGGDTLRLQYLIDPVDPSLLQVADPFGQTLLAYVAAEQRRTGRA